MQKVGWWHCMGVRERDLKNKSEKVSDGAFRMMIWIMRTVDFFYPYVAKRSRGFGIEKGMTVVDYGCGPGRFTIEFAKIVGEEGRVIATDIHEMAIEMVRKKAIKKDIKNIETVLVDGYDSGLPDNLADRVCALNMFSGIRQPAEFLRELQRITKRDGLLVIDDNHQSRDETRRKIAASGVWDIVEESKDHLRCRPRQEAGTAE
jgi:SAM-dependent methyltransferase